MRTLISVLAVSSLFVACSPKSDDAPKPNPFVFTEDYKPTEKPANAASDLYLKDIIVKLNGSSKIVPDDETFMNTMIKDSQSVPIDNSTEERIKALAELDATGLNFLNEIKNNCTIQSPTVNNTGTAGSGGTTTSSTTSSTTGTNCPLLKKSQSSQTTTYSKAEINEDSRVARMDVSVSGITSGEQEIKNENIVSLSGARRMSFYLNIKGNLSFTQINDKQETIGRMTAEGRLELVLANADVISGVLKLESVTVNDQTEIRMLLDAQSKMGAVRVVMFQKPGVELPEVYVNGTVVDPETIRNLKLNADK